MGSVWQVLFRVDRTVRQRCDGKSVSGPSGLFDIDASDAFDVILASDRAKSLGKHNTITVTVNFSFY